MSLSANLNGKRALVTGASSGIGKHFAALLASSGAYVVGVARRVEKLNDTVDTIVANGYQAEACELDLTSPEAIEAFIANQPVFDIVVNNAGISRSEPILTQSLADIEAMWATNLRAPLLVSQAAASKMVESGVAGSIVNIASILGLRQGGQLTGYATTKAGLIQLTKQMALELARHNITVNAIAPGYIATEINAEFFASAPGKALVKRIPQRHLGAPADLDGALLLLASDASRFITGSVIAVDGGHLLSQL